MGRDMAATDARNQVHGRTAIPVGCIRWFGATMSKKLPFGIVAEPRSANTKAAVIDVDDHMAKSSLHVNTWWSGEGITVTVDDENGKRQQIDLSWQEWRALKMAVKAVRD